MIDPEIRLCICDLINARHCPIHQDDEASVYDNQLRDMAKSKQEAWRVADILKNELEQLRENCRKVSDDRDHWYAQFCKLETERASCCSAMEEALNKIATLGSGPAAYTSEFTNEVMGITRGALNAKSDT
jgi:methionyl-tRNA formyltransferase